MHSNKLELQQFCKSCKSYYFGGTFHCDSVYPMKFSFVSDLRTIYTGSLNNISIVTTKIN